MKLPLKIRKERWDQQPSPSPEFFHSQHLFFSTRNNVALTATQAKLCFTRKILFKNIGLIHCSPHLFINHLKKQWMLSTLGQVDYNIQMAEREIYFDLKISVMVCWRIFLNKHQAVKHLTLKNCYRKSKGSTQNSQQLLNHVI